MDISNSLVAKSEQLNAVDIVAPRTFTVEKVTAGSAEQPFDFHLVESPGHPYRPSKGMRRVIARGWGVQAEVYAGRRFTLFCNPDVLWAGAPVGGIQISHMSDIKEAFTVPLALSKTKRVMYRVEPLPDAPTEPTAEQVAASTNIDKLRAMYAISGDERREQITARVAEIKGAS